MKQTSKYDAQITISRIWFIGSPILIALFIFITMPRVSYSDGEHYTWIINSQSPGLSLIVSAFVYSTNNRDMLKQKLVDNFFVKLVVYFSLAYFLLLTAILVSGVLADQRNVKIIDYLNGFALIINFLQVLLLSLLGIFFIKDDTK